MVVALNKRLYVVKRASKDSILWEVFRYTKTRPYKYCFTAINQEHAINYLESIGYKIAY